MSTYHDEKYDQIKTLLNKSRLLKEQVSIKRDNLGKSIQDKINQDVESEYEVADDGDDIEESPDDKVQKYRISGGIIALHGKDKSDVEITSEEKLAFQETMDEFVQEVSNMVDFNPLHIYEKNVIWSGFLRKQNLTFIFNLNDGVYFEIDTMIKLDTDLLETQKKLEKYFSKFESKWADIISNRIKTKVGDDKPTQKKEYETFRPSTKPIGL